ncbi:MAG: hypothetical protein ACTSUK_07175 [Promethearchaeota archaeon]
MLAFEGFEQFIQYLLNIPIEVTLFLIFIGVFEFLPSFLCAYALKKHMVVGKLNNWQWAAVYGGFWGALVLILDYLLTDVQMTQFLAIGFGLILSFFFFVPIFNAISMEAKKTYIYLIDMEAQDITPKYCYTYNKEDKTYIVEIDNDGHEPLLAFVKRMFKRKWEFRCEGIVLEFTTKRIFRAIIGTYMEKHAVKEEIDGKMKNVRYYEVMPVEAHKHTLVKFLMNLHRFEDIMEEMEDLWDENAELKGQINVLARKRAQKMIESLNKALFGDLDVEYNEVVAKLGEDEEESEEEDEPE